MDFVIITVLLISVMAAYSYWKKSKEKDKDIARLIAQNSSLYDQANKSKKQLEQEKLRVINEYGKLKRELVSQCQLDKALLISEHNQALENNEKEKTKVIDEYSQLKAKLASEREAEKAKLTSDYEAKKAKLISKSNQSIKDYEIKKADLIRDYIQTRDKVMHEYHKALEEFEQEKQEAIAERKKAIDDCRKHEEQLKRQHDFKNQVLNERENQLAEREKLMKLKVKSIPVLAKYFSDLEFQKDSIREAYLLQKERPAVKASDVVSEIRREKHTLNLRLKEAEYLVKYYEQAAPWLAEADDDYIDPELNKTGIEDFGENKDAASFWLSKDEFTQLTSQEKYQLALERYKKRAKTNAEIGRDYERYVGYQYEAKGYVVEYRGIVDGFEDRGRDLLCHKDGKTLVVQCKYWSKKKIIHENHINQLFGTTLKYFLEQHPRATFYDFFTALEKRTIAPVFVTSTTLSETAAEFASSLNISVAENKSLGDYPIIKCNINRSTGEKIYHLPFDQQYDRVKITGNGESYAMTVAEAEAKGFRRAKKWLGE